MDFEDYLKTVHAGGYTGTDDDMPDAFEAWLSQLDTAEVMEMAENWGDLLVKEVRAMVEAEKQ